MARRTMGGAWEHFLANRMRCEVEAIKSESERERSGTHALIEKIWLLFHEKKRAWPCEKMEQKKERDTELAISSESKKVLAFDWDSCNGLLPSGHLHGQCSRRLFDHYEAPQSDSFAVRGRARVGR